MTLSSQVVGTLLVLAVVVGVAALAVGIAALNGQRRVRRAYGAFARGSSDDVLTLLERHINQVERLRADVVELRRYADEIRELHSGAVSHVGTVRYDAFEDMGGRLSFSTAFLDEGGDGLLFTAMNGRHDTRVYTKPVTGGSSRHNLSNEERIAIKRAMSRRPRTGRNRPAHGDDTDAVPDEILPYSAEEQVRVVDPGMLEPAGHYETPEPYEDEFYEEPFPHMDQGSSPPADQGPRLFDIEQDDLAHDRHREPGPEEGRP